MRVPNNIIIKGKYTAGDEFVDPNTNEPYQGYYYQINESFFKGKVFSINASKIIRKQESNKLLDNPKTKRYSQVSGVTSQQLETPRYAHLPFGSIAGNDFGESRFTKYFAKQLNVYPILIREVDRVAFQELSNNPLYQTLAVEAPSLDDLNALDKTMPGLKAFLIG